MSEHHERKEDILFEFSYVAGNSNAYLIVISNTFGIKLQSSSHCECRMILSCGVCGVKYLIRTT